MSTPAKLRIVGAWSGQLELPDVDTCTVRDLRATIAERAGWDAESVVLICGGRTLKDLAPMDSQNHNNATNSKILEGSEGAPGGEAERFCSLREAGVGASSRLLVSRKRSKEEAAAFAPLEERSVRLARLRATAEKMAAQSSDGGRIGSYDVQLENQSGQQLTFDSEDDRKALVMGLMLHARGHALVEKERFSEALEVLSMAEEAFSLCNSKHLEAVDNVAMLQLDTVWCFHRLQDSASLGCARDRLKKARMCLQRSHGASMERLRLLQGAFSPELATYVRLELLEGVVSFYSNNFSAARHSLLSAQAKFQQLQVSEEALLQLAAMGFSTEEAKRALRMSGQSTERAVLFLVGERERRETQRREDRKKRAERSEQRGYGKTAGGKLVSMEKLRELQAMGCDKSLAAEALRQSENDLQASLDALLDPSARVALQVSVSSSRKRKLTKATREAMALLEAMGYEKSRAKRALEASGNNEQEAVELLLREDSQPDVATVGGSPSHGGPDCSGTSASRSTNESQPNASNQDGHMEAEDASSSSGSDEDDLEPQDQEMVEEIAKDLSEDPLAAYDVDVEREGEAISEYLAKLDSVDQP